jgi:hypothetical protein
MAESPMTRLARLEASRPKIVEAAPAEWESFDWYASGCPCGKMAGECSIHPRARPNQCPPAGDWRTWMLLAGRGFGKTRTGAEWVRWMAEERLADRMALVAPTAADVRDVMVEGESGILAISPPWFRPTYEPSKRRLTWPNGVIATTYSAEEPNRLRGPQHAAAWVDELGAWSAPGTWDMLLFGLRLGRRPLVCVTTTPKPSKLIKELVADPTTLLVRGSTYDNKANLAPTFFDKVIAKFEGTRLGQQELHAEILEVSDGAWFSRFDPARHLSERAEYDYSLPVYMGIDAGTSRTTAAVWFQVRQVGPHHHRVTVFGEYLHQDAYSAENAAAIKRKGDELPSRGRIDRAWIDPASGQRTSIGPAAYGEFERVLGSRVLERSPGHRVVDGLDQIELLFDQGNLLIHPRCVHLKSAMQNYRRAQRGGELLDQPAMDQSPHEDLVDSLRYGIRSRFPEGRPQPTTMRQTHARNLV